MKVTFDEDPIGFVGQVIDRLIGTDVERWSAGTQINHAGSRYIWRAVAKELERQLLVNGLCIEQAEVDAWTDIGSIIASLNRLRLPEE